MICQKHLIVICSLTIVSTLLCAYDNSKKKIPNNLRDELISVSEKRVDQYKEIIKRINEHKTITQDVKDLLLEIADKYEKDLKKNKIEFETLKSKEIILEKLMRESVIANTFLSATYNSDWLRAKNFCPYGAAANFSFLYVLFRILDAINPASILEMGMGQTSLMTSQYVAYKNKDAHLIIVEHDSGWISRLQSKVVIDKNIKILQMPLKEVTYNGYATKNYDNFFQQLHEFKFDFIVVDGGDTSERYSRTSVLDLIPNNLHQSFVIVFDDFSRPGEQDTVREVLNKLESAHIKYSTAIFQGTKTQRIVCSEDLAYVKYL
ncbi:MAG: hypothetical protein WC365_01970 [Candidatus Babeliales bacterium]|jgi:hypothetical protein